MTGVCHDEKMSLFVRAGHHKSTRKNEQLTSLLDKVYNLDSYIGVYRGDISIILEYVIDGELSLLRFLVDDDAELTHARLSLIKTCATTIASALHVMGVEPVMEM